MKLDKERLRVLAEAATPGPWGTIDRGPFWGESEGDVIDHYGADVVGAEHVAPLGTQETTRGQMWLRDAEFIAAARDAVPALLAENAALAAEVDRLRTNAARYEWLRGQFWHKSNLFVVQGDKSNVMLGTRCPSKSSLDAAIDAAMADKGGATS